MGGSKHCPAPGCGQTTKPGQFACRSHWFALPNPIRDAIWSTWRARPFDRSAHMTNLRAAIRFWRAAA